ncbi:MAG: beta strand repeat-containing protein [Thermomicrobiales bacterium]
MSQRSQQSRRITLVALLVLALVSVVPNAVVHAAPCTTVTSAADDGSPGTLRYAINQVNNVVCNTINFSIGSGPQTIVLGSALPGIFSPVVVDGTTQPGYSVVPLIEVRGNNAQGMRGLIIAGGNSTVKGMSVTGFGGAGGVGIYVLNTGGNTVQGNYVGTNFSGAGGLGNETGIYLDQIGFNTIGGTTQATRNLVSGNAKNGIVISSGSNNIIQGNYIGTNPAGNGALGNFTGVYIVSGAGGNANTNTVGGTAAGAGNVISGNNNDGIAIDGTGGTATGNIVLGNYVGTNAAGNVALGNHFGVFISAASGNTIGGTAPGARNVLSANINVPSPDPIANGDGVSIDGTNGPANGNKVIGNYIGTDATGSVSFPNIEGVYIKSASRNIVGGTTAAERNVISGNHINGVTVDGSQGTSVSNVILGNFIGTNPTGTAAVPNGFGVYIAAADGNTVGGSAAGAGNVISGNTSNGVTIDAHRSTDGSVGSAQFNVVQGNFIGTNAAGTAALGNGLGVYVTSGKSNTIATNVIAASTSNGVTLDGNSSSTTANVIQGNYIGTNAAGSAALGNGFGLYIVNADHNTIGGNGAGQGNIISGSSATGVLITGIGGTGNTLAGNLIGTDATGNVALGNNGYGVKIYGSNSNTIGGFDAASGNVVANTNGDGVAIIAVPAVATANGDSILSNRIFANTGASINLVNGANDGLNAPVLTSVPVTPGAPPTLAATGTVANAPNAQLRIDLFGNPTATSQARVFLGTATVGTDGAGNFATPSSFTYDASNHFITATATNTANGDTSPISGPIGAIGPAPVVRSVSPAAGPTTGGTPATITGANFNTGATVKFGTATATNVKVVDSTTILVTTPAQPLNTGVVDVTVINADTASGTLPQGYLYVNPIGAPQPSVGPVTGAGPLPPTRPPGSVINGPTPIPLPPRR